MHRSHLFFFLCFFIGFSACSSENADALLENSTQSETEAANCTIPSVCQEGLSDDTQYLILTANSVNGVYAYREYGSVDAYATVTIGSGSDTFSNAFSNEPEFEISVVSAVISNVTVSSPNWTNYEQSIS